MASRSSAAALCESEERFRLLVQDVQGYAIFMLDVQGRISSWNAGAQRLESVGTLAGGIAHDLNNVLAPILMTASLLRETFSDPESRGMLTDIELSAQRGADIIGQLLVFGCGVESQSSTRRRGGGWLKAPSRS